MNMRLRICFMMVAVAFAGSVMPIRGADPKSQFSPDKLTKLFGDIQEFRIPQNVLIKEESGRPALIGTTAPYASLEGTKSYSGPTEYGVAFRMKPTKAAGAGFYMQLLTQTRPDKAAQGVHLTISNAPQYNYVSHSLSLTGAKDTKPQSGTLFFEAVSERSLAWSEEMRQTIEAQIANAPKISETLFTIRCVIAGRSFKWWLNGRFLGEMTLPPEFALSGKPNIQVTPNTELLSFRARPATETNSAYEPISIGGNVNSGTIGNQRVKNDSLPGQPGLIDPFVSKTAKIAGIPFEFAAPDHRGQDHLDVGQSWNRFGALPGYFMSNQGAFGGRWISASRIDPARIALQVPRGRYKALHLIAVSDDRANSIPLVSAQFYRPDAGHPVNFAGKVPGLKGTSQGSNVVPVKLENGSSINLHHVTIPLDPDQFAWFDDLDAIGLEITKKVYYYRAYPDPLEYSYHAGGLPSSVQIYAMTLERAGVGVDLQPDVYGHVWTAPARPSYSVTVRNETGKPTTANLVITTRSNDGKETTRQEKSVQLPAGDAPVKVAVTLDPKRYGLHDLVVESTAGNEKASWKRNFAYLHENTREQAVWEDGHGPIFGYWGWGGGHTTPTVDREIPTMAAAGAETSTSNLSRHPKEVQELAKKYRFISEAAFDAGVMYRTGWVFQGPGYLKWDPANKEASAKELIADLKKNYMAPGPLSRPTYVPFFAEPQLGVITTGIWPSHYGEEYKLTASEQATFESMLARYLVSAGAIRKEWPHLKLLLPYGDPMNAAVFLRLNEQVRSLIDGVALDLPGFERLPEQQVNQVVLNRMYPVLGDIQKYKKDPYYVLVEGTHVSSKDLDTQQIGQANVSIRNYLVLMGYGIMRFDSGNSPFDCANYWGENHYGGGWCTRLPLTMPKISYAHLATITRQLNRANFVKYVPTGSTSTYCQQYRHYKTGALVHPFWTIRGKRPVSIKVPAGTTLELVDPHDNATTLREQNGVVTFTVDQSPVYLNGLKGDPEITLGESDHSDSLPGENSRKVANLGDGLWKLSTDDDPEYRNNKKLQIERFPGKMSAQPVSAPQAQGQRALAVHLEKQEKDRGVMPFFTTIRPATPLVLPGKGSSLGLWIHASSDWGRVVYSLRDAKGEKWVSVGTKDDWNCDDIHGWSNFCFDGWRYVKFQMPASAPYDSYREHGTSWWGSYGGDGVVDLPLKLEKVIVERRPKAIYGNDLVAVKPDDVLLGDMYVEYNSAADQTEEAVRLSALRMPLPASVSALDNPVARLQQSGVGAPTKVTKVTDPEREYDGTRCHVHFDLVPGAKSYDAWVSPYQDGRGAMQLGANWTKSGELIQGLRPDRDFYVFIVYKDKDGKDSKPSAPLKFLLKDRFGYK